MTIKDWPEKEKPREKLLLTGASSLTNAELLAICFRVGTYEKTAVDLARECLQNFGGFRKLLNSSAEDFCRVKGLGLTKYALLQCILEINRRYLQETLEKNNLFTMPEQVKLFLTAKLRDLPYEIFACLFLDNKNYLITFEELFHGSVNGALINKRELVKKILYYNASAVILVHNHPSGDPTPSSADIKLTHALKELLAFIDVRLLDHFIVGESKVASLVEMGAL